MTYTQLMLTLDSTGPILLAGGYGVVGGELAALLHQHHPTIPLLLAGRNPERGSALASAVGADLLHWDLARATRPTAGIRALVTTVTDTGDTALRTCLSAGIPHVDIARRTSRIARALAICAAQPPTAPVVLASAWMGGVVPRLVARLGEETGGAQDVDITIRYDLADRAGDNSAEFVDTISLTFEVGPTGAERRVTPLRDTETVRIGHDLVRVTQLETPEQFTLPMTLDSQRVRTRMGYSSASANRSLVALRRLGFFRLTRNGRFNSLSRRLLHQPGPGGEARLRIVVTGPTGTRDITLSDPAGQAHLTAVGALLAVRDALDSSPRVLFPELAPTESLLTDLRAFDVLVADTPHRAADGSTTLAA